MRRMRERKNRGKYIKEILKGLIDENKLKRRRKDKLTEDDDTEKASKKTRIGYLVRVLNIIKGGTGDWSQAA